MAVDERNQRTMEMTMRGRGGAAATRRQQQQHQQLRGPAAPSGCGEEAWSHVSHAGVDVFLPRGKGVVAADPTDRAWVIASNPDVPFVDALSEIAATKRQWGVGYDPDTERALTALVTPRPGGASS